MKAQAKYTASEWFMDNGLQVVFVKKAPSTVSYFSVWYKCGSTQDKLKKSGVAHFLEHMAFEINDRKFGKILDKMGAESNAFTTYNTICFYEIFDKSNIETICENEAIRMRSIEIDDRLFQSEKGAILEERNTSIDNNPEGALAECTYSCLFNRTAGGTEVIGWRHEIESITKEDLYKYHQKWFAPNNAIIVVVGDFDFGKTKETIRKYFKDIPAKKIPPKTIGYDHIHPVRHSITYSSVKLTSASVEFLYKVPRLNFRQKLSLKLAISALNLPNAEIKHVMTYVLKKAFNCDFYYVQDLFAYDFVEISVNTSLNNLKNCELLWTYFKSRITKGLSQELIDTVKKKYLAELAYQQDDISKIGHFIGYKLITGYSLDDALSEREIMQSISVEECQKVLNQLFSQKEIATVRSFSKGYDRE